MSDDEVRHCIIGVFFESPILKHQAQDLAGLAREPQWAMSLGKFRAPLVAVARKLVAYLLAGDRAYFAQLISSVPATAAA